MAGIAEFLYPIIGRTIDINGNSTDEEATCRAACGQIQELAQLAATIPIGRANGPAAWTQIIEWCSKNKDSVFSPIVDIFASCINEENYKALHDETDLPIPIVQFTGATKFSWVNKEFFAYGAYVWISNPNAQLNIGDLTEISQITASVLLRGGLIEIGGTAQDAASALDHLRRSVYSRDDEKEWSSYTPRSNHANFLRPEAIGLSEGEQTIRRIACHIMDKIQPLANNSLYSEYMSQPDSPYQTILRAINTGVFNYQGNAQRVRPTTLAIIICKNLVGYKGIVPDKTTRGAISYGITTIRGTQEVWDKGDPLIGADSPWSESTKDKIRLINNDLPPLTEDLYESLTGDNPGRYQRAWTAVEPFLGINSAVRWPEVPVRKQAIFMAWLVGVIEGTGNGAGRPSMDDTGELCRDLIKNMDCFMIQTLCTLNIPSGEGPLPKAFEDSMNSLRRDIGPTGQRITRALIGVFYKDLFVPSASLHTAFMALLTRYKIKYKDYQFIDFKLNASSLITVSAGIRLIQLAFENTLFKQLMKQYFHGEYVKAAKVASKLNTSGYLLAGIFAQMGLAPQFTQKDYVHILILSRELMMKAGQFQNYIIQPEMMNSFSPRELARWRETISVITSGGVRQTLRSMEILKRLSPSGFAEALNTNNPLGNMTSAFQNLGDKNLDPDVISGIDDEIGESVAEHVANIQQDRNANRRQVVNNFNFA